MKYFVRHCFAEQNKFSAFSCAQSGLRKVGRTSYVLLRNRISISLLSCLLAVCILISLCGCQKQETEIQSVSLPTNVPTASELVSSSLIDPATDWDQYDALIEKIKTETDLALRAEYIHEAEDILMAGYWIIPLYVYTLPVLVKPYVEHYFCTKNSLIDFAQLDLSNGETTLCFGSSTEPASFDPTLYAEYDCLTASLICFRGLLQYSDDGELVYDLAENITVSEDGLQYTVTLKEGLLWSDGIPITAADFAYSWQRTINPSTGAIYEYLFSNIVGYDEGQLEIELLDDRTFSFSLYTPCPYMNSLLAYNPFFPVRQDIVESNANWESSPGAWAQNAGFVCSGPYTVKEWKHNGYIVYEKNDLYWNANASSVRTIEQMVQGDNITVYSAYAAGDMDITIKIPQVILGELQKKKDPELHIESNLGTSYLFLPTNSDFLADKTLEEAACVRKALALLIDRSFICDVILQDGSQPIGSFLPVGMSDGNGGIVHENYDAYFNPVGISEDTEATLNEARTLLMAAGYRFDDDGTLSNETPLTVTLTSFSSLSLFESIQQDLNVLGIASTISSQDFSMIYTERDNGSVQLSSSGWLADFDDPISMLEIMTTSSYYNDGCFGR